jgi:hypothetical protein
LNTIFYIMLPPSDILDFMPEGVEEQGFNPENTNKAPEIGKENFVDFARYAKGSNVPTTFHGEANEALSQVLSDKYEGRDVYLLAKALLPTSLIGAKEWRDVEARTLGLEDLSPTERVYAVHWADALSRAKDLSIRREDLAAKEKSEGQNSKAFDDDLETFTDKAEAAEHAYDLLIKQEKKATGAGFINKIHRYDLTPERITEVRGKVEDHFKNPQNQGS